MSNGKFFTFPLPMLGMDIPEKRILQHIASESMYRAGANGENVGHEQICEAASKQCLSDFQITNEEHKRIVRGSIICGVTFGSIKAIIEECERTQQFVGLHERSYGPSPLVFISAELLWGCHGGDFPTYRDFSTLCAINSVIGFKKSPVLIRRQMIIARQLGFKSPAVMAAELRHRKKLKPLTIQQLRDALDRLETEDVIKRYQASPRNVYFSTTLEYDDLKKSVDASRAKRGKVAFRREVERGTTTEPQRNRLKRKSQKEAEKEPLKNEEPKENHNGTTDGTTTGTANGTTKISVLKEVSLNKCPQTNVETEAALVSLGEAKEELRPEYKPPTLEDVQGFNLFKQPAPAGLAAQWFNEHGNDPRWTEKDWKGHYSKWLSNASKRAAKAQRTAEAIA